MGLSLTQLQTFARLSVLGNFARTGHELGITPTAVALQIQALSKQLGVPLIEIVRRRPVLTPAGRALAQRSQAVLDSVAQLEDEMRQFTAALADQLALGATLTISDYVLTPLLAAFKAQNPDVYIDVQMANPSLLAERLRARTVMLALADDLPAHADLDAIPFAEDQIVLIVPAVGHRLSQRRTVHASDLVDEGFVGREPGAPSRVLTERELATHGVHVQTRLVVPSWEGVTRAVAAGLGIAFVSSLVVERPTDHPGLRVVHVRDLNLRRTLSVFTLRNTALSPCAVKFIEFVKRTRTPRTATMSRHTA